MEIRTTNHKDEKADYYDQGGIVTKDIVRAKLTHEQYIGWCLGQAMTYSLRAQWKHREKKDQHRDYEKAIFYLKEIMLVEEDEPEQLEMFDKEETSLLTKTYKTYEEILQDAIDNTRFKTRRT